MSLAKNLAKQVAAVRFENANLIAEMEGLKAENAKLKAIVKRSQQMVAAITQVLEDAHKDLKLLAEQDGEGKG